MSGNRFSAVFYASSIAMTLSGIDDGVVVDANEPFLRLVGRPREEVIGRSTLELELWRDPEQRRRAVAQLKAEGCFRDLEMELRAASGEEVSYLCSGDRVEVDGKDLLLVSAIDITERRKAEAALRASEERYHQLFELESDALFLVDRETHAILEANASATRLYGYSRDELLELRSTDLSAEPEPTRLAMSQQATRVTTRWHRKKSGEVFPVDIAASYLRQGERIVQLAAIRDITERVAAERGLRESEGRFAAFMDHLPSMVLIKDDELRPLYANRLFREYFPADEWMGKRPSETFTEDVAREMVEKDRQALADGYTEYEETCRRARARRAAYEHRNSRSSVRTALRSSPPSSRISPSSGARRRRCATPSASRRSARSPAASPTTSTICWVGSSATSRWRAISWSRARSWPTISTRRSPPSPAPVA